MTRQEEFKTSRGMTRQGEFNHSVTRQGEFNRSMTKQGEFQTSCSMTRLLI